MGGTLRSVPRRYRERDENHQHSRAAAHREGERSASGRQLPLRPHTRRLSHAQPPPSHALHATFSISRGAIHVTGQMLASEAPAIGKSISGLEQTAMAGPLPGPAKYAVIELSMSDRVGLLSDVTALLAKQHLSVISRT